MLYGNRSHLVWVFRCITLDIYTRVCTIGFGLRQGVTMNSRELKQKLTAAGCKYVRAGKGSHEMWQSAAGKKFQVPCPKKNYGLGILKHILKDAGTY